jgi:hypothetical protein
LLHHFLLCLFEGSFLDLVEETHGSMMMRMIVGER